MAEQGWFEGQRVQLIDGEIVQMPPQGYQHTKALMLVFKFLSEAFGAEHWVRTQFQVDLNDDSQPEPDISVAEHPFEWYKDHPTTALLVAEISDSSLRLDRRKAGLYASCGIPEYWIVNLQSPRLEVHRQPIADPQHEFGHRYADVRVLGEEETISPQAKAEAKIVVRRFFE
jgi:Uma2 family endonuclease